MKTSTYTRDTVRSIICKLKKIKIKFAELSFYVIEKDVAKDVFLHFEATSIEIFQALYKSLAL